MAQTSSRPPCGESSGFQVPSTVGDESFSRNAPFNCVPVSMSQTVQGTGT